MKTIANLLCGYNRKRPKKKNVSEIWILNKIRKGKKIHRSIEEGKEEYFLLGNTSKSSSSSIFESDKRLIQ